MHAALKSDGSVVIWGVDHSPGSTSSVSQQLSSGIVSIVGNIYAFAALDSDGVNVPADGTACDDGDPSTTGDVYVNGVCQGTPSNSPPVVDDFILEYHAGTYEALYAGVLGSDPVSYTHLTLPTTR